VAEEDFSNACYHSMVLNQSSSDWDARHCIRMPESWAFWPSSSVFFYNSLVAFCSISIAIYIFGEIYYSMVLYQRRSTLLRKHLVQFPFDGLCFSHPSQSYRHLWLGLQIDQLWFPIIDLLMVLVKLRWLRISFASYRASQCCLPDSMVSCMSSICIYRCHLNCSRWSSCLFKACFSL
jgi:hypothetical protein